MKYHLACFVACFGLCLCTKSKSSELISKVFTGYNTAVIPKCDNQDQLNVTFALSLNQILNVDQVQQLVKLNVWVGMRWVDCNLKWNPADHGNISFVVLPVERFWIPDISFKDSISVELWGIKDYTGTLHHNSQVEYNFPTTLEVPCHLNTRNFPFDEQACNLTIGSWIYGVKDFNIITYSSSANLAYLKSHKEWDVLKAPVKTVIVKEHWLQQESELLFYTIYLKRKPKYYVSFLIEPAVFFLALGSLGHLLIFESQEKISFALTILDTLVWLKLYSAEHLPAAAENSSILGEFLNISFVVTVVSIFWQVFVIFLYYFDYGMPLWMENYLIKPMEFITYGRQVTIEWLENATDEEKWRAFSRYIDSLGFIVYISCVISMCFYYYSLVPK